LISVFPPSTSCVSNLAAKRISEFADATTISTTNTATAFELVENSYVQTQVYRLVIEYDKPDAKIDLGSLGKPFLPPEALQPRLEVLRGIKLYAQKLSEIMGDTQLNQFDEQTKEFGQALMDLNKNEVLKKALEANVDEKDLKILATGVNALGSWFIEYKRQKGVQEVIQEMQTPIQDISAAFIKDIGDIPDKQSKGGKGLRGQQWNEYDEIIRDQDLFIRKNINKFDPTIKREEVSKLLQLVREKRIADETLKATQQSLIQLVKAHNNLLQALDESNYDIDVLISQLTSEGKRIKTFYESLTTKQ
jgi:hypothetical protein